MGKHAVAEAASEPTVAEEPQRATRKGGLRRRHPPAQVLAPRPLVLEEEKKEDFAHYVCELFRKLTKIFEEYSGDIDDLKKQCIEAVDEFFKYVHKYIPPHAVPKWLQNVTTDTFKLMVGELVEICKVANLLTVTVKIVALLFFGPVGLIFASTTMNAFTDALNRICQSPAVGLFLNQCKDHNLMEETLRTVCKWTGDNLDALKERTKLWRKKSHKDKMADVNDKAAEWANLNGW